MDRAIVMAPAAVSLVTWFDEDTGGKSLAKLARYSGQGVDYDMSKLPETRLWKVGRYALALPFAGLPATSPVQKIGRARPEGARPVDSQCLKTIASSFSARIFLPQRLPWHVA